MRFRVPSYFVAAHPIPPRVEFVLMKICLQTVGLAHPSNDAYHFREAYNEPERLERCVKQFVDEPAD